MADLVSDHLAALKPSVESGFFVFGGASLDEPVKEGEGPKINGSVMVAVAESKEEVLDKLKADVYYTSGVWDVEKNPVAFLPDRDEG
ncbi:hypothetical protein LTR54_005484 [Friedmanniomyces endolithicus]|nr:hypothetical protein LTR54_005484 [Friedmanniomyces endolithicus]